MSNAGMTGLTMGMSTPDTAKRQDRRRSFVDPGNSYADYVQKVSFGTYGRRMATCSTSLRRVWDLTDTGNGRWWRSGKHTAAPQLDWSIPNLVVVGDVW
jgi:hypothetical protein